VKAGTECSLLLISFRGQLRSGGQLILQHMRTHRGYTGRSLGAASVLTKFTQLSRYDSAMPSGEIKVKRLEFLALKQGAMTVREYVPSLLSFPAMLLGILIQMRRSRIVSIGV